MNDRGGKKRKIIYDSSNIRDSYANAVRLSAVQEEVVIGFGISQSPDSSKSDADVRSITSIILNPYAAKRLALLLDNAVQDYEARYGRLENRIIQPEAGRPGSSSSEGPSEPERTDEKARLLFQLVEGLDVQVGIERSFKILDRSILADRFLLGFKKDTVSGDSNKKILDICERIGMPGNYLEAFRKGLAGANIVLFGFEKDGKYRLYKAYLEFGARFADVDMERPAPFLLHQGFKWDTGDNRKQAMADYRCFPLFSIEGIIERLRGIYDTGRGREAIEIAEGLLRDAYNKVGPDEVLYLEVEEGDNPRRSFDINIYRANLRMKDLNPMLERIYRCYSVPEERFRALYEPVKNRIFGHLSGGIDRHGRDFMTIYFGVKGSSMIPRVKP
jgi:hypothetical protein